MLYSAEHAAAPVPASHHLQSQPILQGRDKFFCCAVLSMQRPLELLLMPGLAFDRQGHRLGRGGG